MAPVLQLQSCFKLSLSIPFDFSIFFLWLSLSRRRRGDYGTQFDGMNVINFYGSPSTIKHEEKENYNSEDDDDGDNGGDSDNDADDDYAGT